jgi:hypothetical protein
VAADEKVNGTERVNLRLSTELCAYLDQLAEIGIHGKTPTEVGKTLIAIEVERLVREGVLKLRKSRNRSA